MAITLENIRKAADKKFAPVEFDLGDGKAPVRLKNPIRLDKKVRDQVTGLRETLGEEGADVEKVVSDVLTKVAESASEGKRLVAAADGDTAVLLQILNSWMEGEGTGEASASDD